MTYRNETIHQNLYCEHNWWRLNSKISTKFDCHCNNAWPCTVLHNNWILTELNIRNTDIQTNRTDTIELGLQLRTYYTDTIIEPFNCTISPNPRYTTTYRLPTTDYLLSYISLWNDTFYDIWYYPYNHLL